jgi:serine/threonine protein kinase
MEGSEDQAPTHTAPTAPTLILVPNNRAARRVLAENRHLRYRLPNDTYGLCVSFTDPEKRVFKLGRAQSEVDIFLPDANGADISKHQCSFTVTERGAVLLEDKSSKKTTVPYSSNNGQQAIPFLRDRRTVLVARGINNLLSIGNTGKDGYYQFEIQWHCDGLYDLPNKDDPYRTGPRKSRQKKYVQVERIGGGGFGHVWLVVDAHTGGLMAVKKFHSLEGRNLEFATREVDNLFRINRTSAIHHDHILEILGYEKGDDWGEIFMPVKMGNLKTLADATEVDMDTLAMMVLRQMVLALACIAEHGIVHRDIKPENILWEYDQYNNYHFRLGDFGLSNDPALAITVAGTEPFMAPEIWYRQKQSAKVDIWSLFATIVWVKNTSEFRDMLLEAAPRIHAALVDASSLDEFRYIRAMASMTPRNRPSAKELVAMFQTLDDGGAAVDGLADALGTALSLNQTGEDEQGDDGVRPRRRRRPSDDELYAQVAIQPVEDDAQDQDPAVPFYEAYPPNLRNYNYHWEDNGEGSSSDYFPPPTGASPRGSRGGPSDQVSVVLCHA